MKTKLIYFCTCIAVIVSACIKDDEDLIKEVPKEIIRTKLDPIIYPQIVESFPESTSALIKYPQLFSDTVQKKILIKDSSLVYITFVAEKATYKNTVGWYSYNINNPPTKVEDLSLQVLFPNVSVKDEGGVLLEGDMLQLGDKKFPKGTVIGFFLIVDGWHDGKIIYTNNTHYTDLPFNIGQKQQHVIYKEKNGKNIILGFEDMVFEEADRDYNDLLFIISDNKEGYESISFDLTKITTL